MQLLRAAGTLLEQSLEHVSGMSAASEEANNAGENTGGWSSMVCCGHWMDDATSDDLINEDPSSIPSSWKLMSKLMRPLFKLSI